MPSGYVAEKIKAGNNSNVLKNLAAAKLEQLKKTKVNYRTDSLLNFIPDVSKDLLAPKHMAPFLDLLELTGSEGGVRAVVAAPPQHGKAIKCSEPMLTDRGFIAAGEVVIGDRLVGSDGNWTTVTGVFPQGVKPLLRVSFTDCSFLDTCAEHLWEVKQRYGGPARVKSTGELVGDLAESDERCKWRIPVVKPFVGTNRELPIDAYWLGLWLGDGTSLSSAVTSMDDQISGYVQGYADSLGMRMTVTPREGSKASTFSIIESSRTGHGRTNGLIDRMRSLNVIGNKHIPESYLTADLATRLALLQGLCDTDGTVALNGSQQTYTTTDAPLFEGFKTLVASLGGVCTVYSRPAADKIAYTISFRLPEGMEGFRLKRKQDRLTAYTPRHEPRRFIKSIEAIGSDEAVCFSVDSKDKLFCAGRDLVVTHNSQCVIHCLLWLAIRYPGRKHAYVTYSQERADYVSNQLQTLAESINILEAGRLSIVRLKGGSEIKFTSIGGSLTGFTVDGLLIIDDPIKDRADAESPTIRQKTVDWFIDVARSRRHPKTSIICMATRWHPEDLSGALIARDYPYLNLKAIAEGPTNANGTVIGDPLNRLPGEALFPEFKPADFFVEEQSDDYSWQSLYQGEPRGRGNTVFQWPDVTDLSWLYEPRPVSYWDRLSIGVDFAYTAKTSSDYSVAVVIGEKDNILHVLDVHRFQIETRDFRGRLEGLKKQYPGATMATYVASTELGGVEFVREADIEIRGMIAKQDKFLRAMPTSAAWNSRQFKLPQKAVWRDAFLQEVCGFTGIKDKHDDQVDALAAAFDGLGPKPTTYRSAILTGVGLEHGQVSLDAIGGDPIARYAQSQGWTRSDSGGGF